MIENDHDALSYTGQAGEQARVSVSPQGTTAIGSYTLKGVTVPLPLEGTTISFQLEKQPNDQPMVLQLTMDFNAQGSYRVGVREVTNEPNNECVHVWDGPPILFKTFSFFVN